jgi:la-related protein 1
LELLQCGPGADGGAHLDRLCVNADPNYGAVWFACKQHTTDAAVEVMRRARSRIQCELSEHRKLYQVALLRNQYPNQDFTGTIDDKAAASWRSSHLSSLDSLYPNMNAQSPADRHKILFGADPIVP